MIDGNIISITDVCDFQGGSQPPKSEWSEKPLDGYIRMLQIRDFTQAKKEHIAFVKQSKKLRTCNKDDVLIGRYGASVGKILTGLEGAYNVAIMKTVPDTDKLNTNFLYFLLKSPTFQNFIQNVAVRAAQAGFSKKDLKKYKFFLPKSIDDQIKIANLLSQVEALIGKREESIKLLDELLKSTFLNMFGDPVLNTKGWDKVTIEDIAKKEKYSIKRGPFGGALKKEIFVSDGYLVYEQYHALNNDFSMARYFITEEKFQELKAFEVKSGDIIISCSGVYLGKLAIVPPDIKKGIINQALLKISLDENKMNNILFTYIFRNENFINKFFGSNRGAGIPNFPPMKEFKKFKFIKPPKPLQDKFATIVQQVEESKKKYQESLNQLHQLFGSLSQRAFKVELDFLKDRKKKIIFKINGKEINLKKDKTNLINISSSSFINSYRKEMERINNFSNNIGINNKSLYDINSARNSLNHFDAYKKEIEKIRKISSPLSNLNRDIFDLKKPYEPFLNSSLTSIYNSHTKDLMQRINGLKFTSLSQLVSNSISKALNTKHSYNTALKQLEMLKPLSSLGDNYESLINKYNSRISNLTCILESIPKLTDIIDDELFDDVYLSATYDDIKELIFRLINDGKLKQVFDEKSKTLIVKKANDETN